MKAEIAIIGLGQLGASVGMALKEGKTPLHLVGCDKKSGIVSAAQAMGAIDEARNLKNAVKDAAIVLLCLPLGEIRETLKRIGPELREGAIVMDMAPVKRVVLEWAKEFIPAGRFHLGLVPALKLEALFTSERGLKAAAPDLFKRTVMIVDIPPGTPEPVVELAFDLVRLLGAKPMLTDLAESDGIMVNVHLLPQLVSAALLNATLDQPGWMEGRKLASRAYAGVTGGMAFYDDAVSLRTAALTSPDSVIHSLDVMIAALKGLRDDIEKSDEESVAERLEQAFEGREQWLVERSAADWLNESAEEINVPDFGERVNQMFFGGMVADRMKKKKL